MYYKATTSLGSHQVLPANRPRRRRRTPGDQLHATCRHANSNEEYVHTLIRSLPPTFYRSSFQIARICFFLADQLLFENMASSMTACTMTSLTARLPVRSSPVTRGRSLRVVVRAEKETIKDEVQGAPGMQVLGRHLRSVTDRDLTLHVHGPMRSS